MKCPFTINITQVHQDTWEYDDEGRQTAHEQKLVETRQPIDCAGEECGAWADGRCCYPGTVS